MITTIADTMGTTVVFRDTEGAEIHAGLLRFTRYVAVVEIYDSAVVVRASEVLSELQIVVHERVIYSGRAVVRNVVHTGTMAICELALQDGSWRDVEFTVEMFKNGRLRGQFDDLLQSWRKLYKIWPEYKLVIADMHSYLSELQLWLDQVELGIRCTTDSDHGRLEQEVTEDLARPIIPWINTLFEKFEAVAQRLDDEWLPVHRNYMRRQLHPLVLCAPFAYRTFQKPLGYAGDYEMVNMIVRNRHEGASLFAKVVNTWFLRQPPAQAHRNRIGYLTERLIAESLRTRRDHRNARIFSVACGPAQEVQRFLSQSHISSQTKFTLLDFNDETLRYAQSALGAIQAQHARPTSIEYLKKSVQQIYKESSRAVQQPDKQFDFVYCAGLFDYLPDRTCQILMNTFYDWVVPGGLLLATNVDPSNPMRHGMEHLLDWHLIYRTGRQMRSLVPARASEDHCSVQSDNTGVNVYLEVRKPLHA